MSENSELVNELLERAERVEKHLQEIEGPLPIVLVAERNRLLDLACEAERNEKQSIWINPGLGRTQPASNWRPAGPGYFYSQPRR